MRSIAKAALALFVLAAFSLPVFAGGQSDNKSTASSSSGSSSGAFPVTIDTKYGKVTIAKKPVRVVSVGFADQDIILSFGVVPVAIREWYGEYPSATWPWAQSKLGGAKPGVLSSGDLDIEKVASFAPDLIVGLDSGMTEKEFLLLSKIAPTLAQPAEYVDYGTPWQVKTKIFGKAIGESAKADELVNGIESRYADIRAKNPAFKGATAAVAFYYENMPGAYTSSDIRSRFLSNLGFVIPKAYDELGKDSFYVSFSAERLDLLDVDVIVWVASTNEEIEAIKALPLRQKLKAAREGREVFLGKVQGGAFSFSSPLSLPYIIDAFIPALAAAVDGKTSTPVTLKVE